jgi:flavorubredoxin
MTTRVDEIADGIFRISTFVPDVAPPDGFTFNQFLLRDEEPTLFHCGMRALFPAVSEAVGRVLPLSRLRWIAFGHLEADECGSMNQWLAAAPHAQIMHGALGCMTSIGDLADRAPCPLDDGTVIPIGKKRLLYRATPHVPHGWDAGVLFEETTKTLLCGDLFTHTGNGPARVESDVLAPAIATDAMFLAEAVTPRSGATLRGLAALQPQLLAIMHGSSFAGDGAGTLNGLAAHFDARLRSGPL